MTRLTYERCREPAPSPTTARSTPPASPAAATASSTYPPPSAFIRRTATPTNHPQTQGKVKRLHQTQKQWLARQPPAATLTALKAQLDTFTGIYNTERGHRALNGATPTHKYQAGIIATPTGIPTDRPHYRIRYDHIDQGGKISLRRAGRMHHLGVGTRHTGTAVLITLDHDTATVIALTTGRNPQHPTASTPTTLTGATNNKTPAAGRGSI